MLKLPKIFFKKPTMVRFRVLLCETIFTARLKNYSFCCLKMMLATCFKKMLGDAGLIWYQKKSSNTELVSDGGLTVSA